MRYPEWIGVFSLTVLLLSCAPAPVMKKEVRSYEDVLMRVQERNIAVKTLMGKGNIKVKSPELSSSGAFYVTLKKPDSLLLVLRGPFGIHVGTLSLTTHSFQFYNAMENTALIGSPDSSTLLSILHIQMPVETILDIFFGAFPVAYDSLLRFSSTGDEYLMAFARGGKIIEYRIDAQTFIITDYLVKDSEDKVLFKGEASQLTKGSDVSTPSVLYISFPNEARSVSLAYKDVSLNEEVSCSFSIPEGVKVVRR